MSEMVTVLAHARAKPGLEERARKILEELVGTTRAEAGCLNYDLHESSQQPGVFMFYENWATAADLEAHGRSEHIARFRKKCGEVLAEGPVVTRWRRVV